MKINAARVARYPNKGSRLPYLDRSVSCSCSVPDQLVEKTNPFFAVSLTDHDSEGKFDDAGSRKGCEKKGVKGLLFETNTPVAEALCIGACASKQFQCSRG
jgi:hypothetical protein